MYLIMKIVKSIIDEIKSEGRYRVFIDILRKSQNFLMLLGRRR